MTKKLIFTLILLGFLFGSVTDRCLADLSDQLDQALEYKKTSNFSEAEAIYRDIITNHPSTDYAVKAKIGLGRMYKRIGRYNEAEPLYKEVLANSPGSEEALEAQKYLTILYIAADRDQEAQAAVNKLKTDFSTHFNLSYALNGIARSYQRYGKEQDAKNIYQGITTDYPGNYHAFLAHKQLVASGAVTEINAAAQAAVSQLAKKFPLIENTNVVFPDVKEALADINDLIVNYPDYPYLPGIVVRVAEKYHTMSLRLENEGNTSQAQVFYQKAAMIYDVFVNEFSGSATGLSHSVGSFYYHRGYSYRELGQYEKSTESFLRLANNFPTHSLATSALFYAGRNYRSLKEAGSISESEANINIKAVYQQLIAIDPNCPSAKYVKHWLKRHNSE